VMCAEKAAAAARAETSRRTEMGRPLIRARGRGRQHMEATDSAYDVGDERLTK
jgi:hypothetical protein